MQIQNLQEQELSLLFHNAKLENWDIEELHIHALLQTHPNDFFIFYANRELIGYCVALKESEKFGFISSVLVLEQFRSLGYGKQIFTFALEYLGKRQIALDSVLGQESFYKKFGFSSYFDVNLYKFIMGSCSLNVELPKTLINAQSLSTSQYSPYLQALLSNKDVMYRAMDKEGTSFAFSFGFKDGYKVTINIEDINDAAILFFSLVKDYPIGTAIYIQTTKLSPLLEAFVKALKMTQVSHLTRMYNKIIS